MYKIGLIIGHSPTAQGCKNTEHNVTEYQFNCDLVRLVQEELIKECVEPIIFYRNKSLTDLVERINNSSVDIIISFHCNAFNKEVSGTETLCYKYSVKSNRLAQYIQARIVKCLALKDRGIKGVTNENGSYLLKYTHMPAVLIEPFFLDNDSDYLVAQSNIEELAKAIAAGLIEYKKTV